MKIMENTNAARGYIEKRWPNKKGFNSETTKAVTNIINEVKKRGDTALIDFTNKFDGVYLTANRLKVNQEDIEKAYKYVTKNQISAIKVAKKRVEKFQKKLLKQMIFKYEKEGVKISSCTSPIQRLGCYVPGGDAPYTSSLVMSIIPAKVAGVPEIVVCSPPRIRDEINPSILVAADICGVDEIYRCGGVQAIAAMAYGTDNIRPVNKIVGPGNKYVLRAKMLVSQDVPIDIPAGPSEIMVLADDTANTRIIALDLISQAEHVDGVSILVTVSKNLAEKVHKEIIQLIPSSPNKRTVIQNLSANGLILVCEDIENAIQFINEFAPEHLEIMMSNGKIIAEKISSAGLVLIGKYSPVSASDYCLGTVHILPTIGFSHVYSGLSVLDFVKRFNIINCSRKGLYRLRKEIQILAETEGLLNHHLAVEGRFRDV
jgi:histidinol dehydrogenase